MVYIIGGAILFVILFVALMYNGLVRMRNRKEEAWSDIDVQLKRRYDLIPNLVNTVKGYATHEQETLAKVTEMRTRALAADGVKEKGEAENMLSGALKTIFAVAENYPDLKASENFAELQRELSDTENKIQSARRFYNATVQDLNTAIQMFPKNVIANFLTLKKKNFLNSVRKRKKRQVTRLRCSFNTKRVVWLRYTQSRERMFGRHFS